MDDVGKWPLSKTKWPTIIQDRLESLAQTVEISILYDDLISRRMSAHGDNIAGSEEDWDGQNCTGESRQSLQHRARALVIKLATEKGWVLEHDGVTMLRFRKELRA